MPQPNNKKKTPKELNDTFWNSNAGRLARIDKPIQAVYPEFAILSGIRGANFDTINKASKTLIKEPFRKKQRFDIRKGLDRPNQARKALGIELIKLFNPIFRNGGNININNMSNRRSLKCGGRHKASTGLAIGLSALNSLGSMIGGIVSANAQRKAIQEYNDQQRVNNQIASSNNLAASVNRNIASNRNLNNFNLDEYIVYKYGGKTRPKYSFGTVFANITKGINTFAPLATSLAAAGSTAPTNIGTSLQQGLINNATDANILRQAATQTFKCGGRKKARSGIARRLESPYITDGGVAIPLGNGLSLLRGATHEDTNETGQTGIGINTGKGEIEAENGEVIQNTGKELRIFSDQPMFNGISPADAVQAGYNPNRVFNAQERLKSRLGIKNPSKKAPWGDNVDIQESDATRTYATPFNERGRRTSYADNYQGWFDPVSYLTSSAFTIADYYSTRRRGETPEEWAERQAVEAQYRSTGYAPNVGFRGGMGRNAAQRAATTRYANQVRGQQIRQTAAYNNRNNRGNNSSINYALERNAAFERRAKSAEKLRTAERWNTVTETPYAPYAGAAESRGVAYPYENAVGTLNLRGGRTERIRTSINRKIQNAKNRINQRRQNNNTNNTETNNSNNQNENWIRRTSRKAANTAKTYGKYGAMGVGVGGLITGAIALGNRKSINTAGTNRNSNNQQAARRNTSSQQNNNRQTARPTRSLRDITRETNAVVNQDFLSPNQRNLIYGAINVGNKGNNNSKKSRGNRTTRANRNTSKRNTTSRRSLKDIARFTAPNYIPTPTRTTIRRAQSVYDLGLTNEQIDRLKEEITQIPSRSRKRFGGRSTTTPVERIGRPRFVIGGSNTYDYTNQFLNSIAPPRVVDNRPIWQRSNFSLPQVANQITGQPANNTSVASTNTNNAPTFNVRSNNLGMDITGRDWIGLGTDILGSLGVGLFNANSLKGLDVNYTIPQYVDETPVAFDTTWHNGAQRANVERNRINARNIIGRNTASANTAVQRMQQSDTDTMMQQNVLWDEKANKEAELRNTAAANEQQVRARNAAARNAYYQNVAQIRNAEQDARNNIRLAQANAISGSLAGLGQAASNFLTSAGQRYEDNNALRAYIASSDEGTLGRLLSAGVQINPDILAGLYNYEVQRPNANSKESKERRSIMLNNLIRNRGYRRQARGLGLI